jgi:hypothetical protein
VSNWTVSLTTGLVTFTTPNAVTLEHSVTKDAVGTTASGRTVISGNPGDFSSFAPYVGSRAYMTGWTHSGNNIPLGSTVVITIYAVAGNGSSITIEVITSGYAAQSDTSTSLTIGVHPAPLVDAVITAGFLFYVPVRFDTDILPVTIQEYGVGGSNSVKLIEVRATDSN